LRDLVGGFADRQVDAGQVADLLARAAQQFGGFVLDHVEQAHQVPFPIGSSDPA
jgi:hypothetical protein